MIIAALHGTLGNLDEILMALVGFAVLVAFTYAISRGNGNQDSDGTD